MECDYELLTTLSIIIRAVYRGPNKFYSLKSLSILFISCLSFLLPTMFYIEYKKTLTPTGDLENFTPKP